MGQSKNNAVTKDVPTKSTQEVSVVGTGKRTLASTKGAPTMQ